MKEFIKKHKVEITYLAVGAIGTILITKKIQGVKYPNKISLNFDEYLPGFDWFKDRPIDSCFAVITYDDGITDIIDDIEGLAKRLAK